MLLVNGECQVTITPPRRLSCVDRVGGSVLIGLCVDRVGSSV